ncbi:MAG TPA: collagen binding domain-containing protein, partial [Desulfitobacterium dehalogenans]|nr:collagen binding domain-containing protein [Desulfitobacterium dehalogenans]
MKKFNSLILVFLLVFQIFRGPMAVSAAGDFTEAVDPGVVTKITVTKDGKELKDILNYRPIMGEAIDLKLEFTLPDGHNYGNGSTLTYPLPTPLKPISGSGPLMGGDGEYATYTISGGNVVITFNDKIRYIGEGGSGGLETIGSFAIKARFEAAGGNTALEQVLVLPGSETITLHFQPIGGKVIEKKVTPENGGMSSSVVDWTVNVNTVMDDLGLSPGKVFVDTLTGNHEYKPGSIEVTRYVLDTAGVRSDDVEVTTSSAITIAENKKSFTLNLTDKYAYEIKYQTIPGDTDEKSQTIKNQATFNGQTASQSATITYGDPLVKTVQQTGEQANWIIKVNGNRKTIKAGTTITDSWDSDQHKLVDGTFKVNDIEGSLPLGLSVVHNAQGFVLTLGQDITEEFTISYSTVPKDLVTGTINIKNTVVRSDRLTDSKSITAYYGQNVLAKSNSNINYQNKTVDWKIELNKAGYSMDSIVVADIFVDKNLKIKNNFKVNGTELTPGAYTFTEKDGDASGDGKGGFTLEIPGPITEPVTITYTTDYDVKGVTNLDKYENTVGLTWKTGGKPYSIATAVASSVKINTEQQNKGYKDGVYDYEKKIFKWKVGINYNFDTITNPVFTDTLSESQVVDRASIKVSKLNLSSGGGGQIVGAPLVEGTDYDLTPEPLANTFTVTFKNPVTGITEPYLIEYESRNKDQYYAPTGTNHSVENTATLTGDGYTVDWTKTVPVAHTDKLITKGYQQEGSSAKLHWTMNLNWGQSTLEDVLITDTVGQDAEGNPNQMIYKDSFKITEMDFKGGTEKPGKGTSHTPGNGLYDVTFADPGSTDFTFKITFNQPIDKAYTVEYDTYFLGASGIAQELKNEAKLSYNTKDKTSGEDNVKSLNANFSFSGSASTKKGQLEINKVDKDDPDKKLSGAVFELWNKQSGGFLIERVSTDVFGVYTFLTKVGQGDYYLKETRAPEGYSLNESEYNTLKKVTIQDMGTPLTPNYVEELIIKNTKLVQAVKLTKSDQTDSSRKLVGAQFTLHDATTDALVEVKDTAGNILPQPFETDESGVITVGNLAPGNYYFKETAAAPYYLQPQEENCKTPVFTITADQIKIQELEMKNTRGMGKILITKVDGADNTSLPGVEFTLTKESMENFSDGSASRTAVTNESGQAEFSNLPYEKYILQETSAHPDYVPNAEPQEVVLAGESDGAIKEVTIPNTKKDHSVKLTKYNQNKTLTLPGAIFELRKEAFGVYGVVSGISAEQLTTDAKGEIFLKDLEPGKYQLIETKAPSGYTLNSEPISFIIEENQSAPLLIEKTNSIIF